MRLHFVFSVSFCEFFISGIRCYCSELRPCLNYQAETLEVKNFVHELCDLGSFLMNSFEIRSLRQEAFSWTAASSAATSQPVSSFKPAEFYASIWFYCLPPLVSALMVGILHVSCAFYSLPVYPYFIFVLVFKQHLSSLVFSPASVYLQRVSSFSWCFATLERLFWCPSTRQDLCSLGHPHNPP